MSYSLLDEIIKEFPFDQKSECQAFEELDRRILNLIAISRISKVKNVPNLSEFKQNNESRHAFLKRAQKKSVTNHCVSLAYESYMNQRVLCIRKNSRIAYHFASKANYRYKDARLDDMFQESTLGLLQAVDKFEITANVRFSTYAAWWIKQSINRYKTTKEKIIYIPPRTSIRINQIKAVNTKFYTEHGRHASHEEIALATGLDIRDVKDCLETEGTIAISSIHSVSNDEDLNLEDYVSKDTYTEGSQIPESLAKGDLSYIMKHLNERERDVIIKRFGLVSSPWKLEEVGEHLGLSRERIRQIENAALIKMNKIANSAR